MLRNHRNGSVYFIFFGLSLLFLLYNYIVKPYTAISKDEITEQEWNNTNTRIYTLPVRLSDTLINLESKLQQIKDYIKSVEQFKDFEKIDYIDRIAKSYEISTFWQRHSNFDVEKHKTSTSVTHKTHLLSTMKCENKLDLLILVTSYGVNIKQRHLVRKYWGQDHFYQRKRWRAYFLMGALDQTSIADTLDEEISVYHDIVLVNVRDSVLKETYIFQAGVEWALKYCSFDFLLKTQENVFVNMKGFFLHLNSEFTPKTNYYAGSVIFKRNVTRTGEGAVQESLYPRQYYPRFCSKESYLLSSDLVEKIYKKFETLPTYPSEDIYVGFLALENGVDPEQNNNFVLNVKTCKFGESVIVYHPVRTEECMKTLYRQSTKPITTL